MSEKSQLEQIRDLSRTLIDAVLKDGPQITLSIRAEDEALEIDGGQLELCREGQQWILEKAVFQSGYPHSLDYVDMVGVGEYLDVTNAAVAIVASLANRLMDREFDRLADEAYANDVLSDQD